ncbi:MAG TPA: AMP-binding protein, partial [Pilimelia sp.]|nr:AMP-binding protein [Pilimelia sp.]
VVPSYLDVLTRALTDRPRDLGRLRVLSVTGEPLRRDAARRWLAANPHIPLVNAYGATELSDDTMHEVLRLPPADDVVTVGRPLPNVGVYVVDDALRLRPLGAPGEIVFSGVAVGAGYVNDPERTRLAFTADPHHPGRRLYRTGDYGRWLPDGRLNFLGRRDQQVKIRGYRIELGEIESVLAGLPGVHSTAVVVVPGEGTRPAALAAFVAGPAAPDAAAATARIRRHLPDYMVPTYVHRLAHLPLTPNGKVDRAALRHLAGTLGHADGPYAAPTTPTERMLATAWAEVLHTPVERIGRADHFFHLGGNSLSAVWLVVRLHGAVSLAQVLRRPVLADLAAALDGAAGAPGPARDGRAAPAAPVPAPASARTRRRRQAAADPLLHRLSAGSAARLVCFPYAGGNAVNFTALAAALARHDIAVYGVDPPGHDLTPDPVPLADPATIAAAVRRELAERTGPPLLLWGHGAGAAAALCLARLLGRGATPVRGLFVAAQALRPAGRLRHAAEAVAALSDRAVVDILRGARAYVSFDRLQDERAAIVGAAYRNDVRTAHLLLADAREDPAAHRIPVPLHVVVADDDPATPPSAGRYRGWGALATAVTLHRLPDGGHYFVRTRAAETAALVAAVGAARPGGTRRDGGTHGRR